MNLSDDLFTWNPGMPDSVEPAATLVVAVTGFSDVGHVQHVLTTNLEAELPYQVLGEFDLDDLLDHRDSRAPIIFDTDHFEGYQRPGLTLSEFTDENGERFLLLTGPEPALRWEGLTRRIIDLIEELGIRQTIITDSIPMATPHTRPVQITRWASRPEMLVGNVPNFGKYQMPASFPAVLSQRLAETGHDYVGLAASVPHYLSEMDYPDATRTLIGAIHQVTGLSLPAHGLAVAAGAIRAELANQVAQSEELGQMLSALEQQYDSTTVEQPALESRHVDVPSADAIGAEVEDFLRSIDDPSDESDETATTAATDDADSDGDDDSAEDSHAHPTQGPAPSQFPDRRSESDDGSQIDRDADAQARRGRMTSDSDSDDSTYHPRRGTTE